MIADAIEYVADGAGVAEFGEVVLGMLLRHDGLLGRLWVIAM